MTRNKSFCRLLEAARGRGTRTRQRPLLRCFPLESQHIGSVLAKPQDFHSKLCSMIRNAKHRVSLASLYVGGSSSSSSGATTATALVHKKEEDEFLRALSCAALKDKVQVKILLDENRAIRPINKSNSISSSDNDHSERTTKPWSSAEAVLECLQHKEGSKSSKSSSALFLFPTLSEPKRSLLPSPLNEIAGVFHCKAYVVDDELILSGANLSQVYFLDRQDRYVTFTNGGGGLVDWYASLIDVLSRYGYRYNGAVDNDSSSSAVRPMLREKRQKRLELCESLSKLLDGSNDFDPCTTTTTGRDDDSVNSNDNCTHDETSRVIAYAVPTFQAPKGFFPTVDVDFPMDATVVRNLVEVALSEDCTSSTGIRLASGYLNPTSNLTNVLAKCKAAGGCLQLLTAGYKSHGFSPKVGQPRRRGDDWVPSIFSAIYEDLEAKLPNAVFWYYERTGWTFHAKGLWITMNPDPQHSHTKDDDCLVAAVVGSGNYGARSEIMDVESNTILVFCNTESELQSRLLAEWTNMCQHAHEGHAIEFPETSLRVKAALPFIRDLF